jgi:hypothetical protein
MSHAIPRVVAACVLAAAGMTVAGSRALVAGTPGTAGTFGTSGPAAAGPAADRQRLVSLFKNVQDVLLTTNSEIIQYGDRFDDIADRLQDREIWDRPVLDEASLLPQVRELNRLKLAVSLIGSGLATKYAQLKAFRAELKDRYPSCEMEIEYYYNLFDKVYEDSRERHRRIMRDMDDLKAWFRNKVERRRQRKAEDTERAAYRPPARHRHARDELWKRRTDRAAPDRQPPPRRLSGDVEPLTGGRNVGRDAPPDPEDEPGDE